MEKQQKSTFGLSKKTNMVIACVASIAAVQNNNWAVAGAVFIAALGITYQFILDMSL